MKKHIIYWLWLPVMLLVANTVTAASDLAKEKRWAEQIEEGLLDGEIILLNDGRYDFVSIFTPAAEKTETAVILMHGMGVHPDWPQVINPLRVSLPESGWTTLSLQLPVLPNEAKPEDYKPLLTEATARIDAGIRFLQKQGAKSIVIIAHSLGAEMAGHFLTKKTPPPVIKGYIGIGMSPDNTTYLSAIDLPVLDLYGEDDLDGVVASAPARAKSASSNKKYTQKSIPDADHFFNDKESQLLDAVIKWLGALST